MGRDGRYEEATEVIRRLTVDWSDKAGDYVYTLNCLHEFSNGERQLVKSESGDLAWAERIAKHYNIEVPKE